MTPKNRRRYLRSTLLTLVAAVAVIFPLYWSSSGMLRALYASWSLNPTITSEADLTSENGSHTFRRVIQRHYLEYDLYIPLEDIVTPDSTDASQRTNFLMQKACGSAKLYIWVPLRFQIPFIGSRIVEWCWKPSLKKS